MTQVIERNRRGSKVPHLAGATICGRYRATTAGVGAGRPQALRTTGPAAAARRRGTSAGGVDLAMACWITGSPGLIFARPRSRGGRAPVAERRCGQSLSEPGIPASGLAGDRLAKGCPAAATDRCFERDHAPDAAGVGVQRVQSRRRYEIVQRPSRIGLARFDPPRPPVPTDTGTEDDHGRDQREHAGGVVTRPPPAGGRLARPGESPPSATGPLRHPRARPGPELVRGGGRPPERPAIPRNPSAARSAPGTPRTSRPTRGSPTPQGQQGGAGDRGLETPAAAGAHRAATAAARNTANSPKPTSPVWVSSRSSRLCVQAGSSPVRRRVT